MDILNSSHTQHVHSLFLFKSLPLIFQLVIYRYTDVVLGIFTLLYSQSLYFHLAKQKLCTHQIKQ